MTTTIVVMACVAAVAGFAAWWHHRQLRPAPTSIPGAPPESLDRADFRAPDAPLLIAVFTSETCSSCAAVWHELSGYESSTIAAQNIEVGREPGLHRRYGIDSVPTAVVVDHSGETQVAFVGPIGQDHRQALAAIVADHG